MGGFVPIIFFTSFVFCVKGGGDFAPPLGVASTSRKVPCGLMRYLSGSSRIIFLPKAEINPHQSEKIFQHH